MIRTCVGAVLGLSLMACGDGTTTRGPTAPTPETSFLAGTWRGPVTLHREGLPDAVGQSTWTFVYQPGSEGASFTTTLTISGLAYLPIGTVQLQTALLPPAPGGRISTLGDYPSPRGCQGDVLSVGTAQIDRIDATFNGGDCAGVLDGPVLFTGSVVLTR